MNNHLSINYVGNDTMYRISNPFVSSSSSKEEKVMTKAINDSLASIIPFTCKNTDGTEIYFNATLVQKLSDLEIPLSQEETYFAIGTLTTQVQVLERLGYTFYGLDLDDIWVVDREIFVNLSVTSVKKIDKTNNTIRFMSPFRMPEFGNPELWLLTRLPESISSKAIYYSLGALAIYMSLNTKMLVEKRGKDINMEEMLARIFGTNLYDFIIHTTTENPKYRTLMAL